MAFAGHPHMPILSIEPPDNRRSRVVAPPDNARSSGTAASGPDRPTPTMRRRQSSCRSQVSVGRLLLESGPRIPCSAW